MSARRKPKFEQGADRRAGSDGPSSKHISSCPLCRRPNLHPTDHHLVPRSRGGKLTETLCRDCHAAVHAHFTNKELEAKYHTVEALLGDHRFRKTIRFIQKQDPWRKTRTRRPRDKRVRGRAG